MYSKKVIETFKNPKFAGKISCPDAVGTVGNIKCGDEIQVYLKINNNRIVDVKFQTYGCPAAIAASDTLCKLVIGKTLEEAEKMNFKEIIYELGEMPKIKYHCSIMGTEALHKAIENYRKKHKGEVMELKYSDKSTLGEVLNHKNGSELLAKYHVPCISCHMATSELDSLTLRDIGGAYSIDIKGLIRDLNNSSSPKKKCIRFQTPIKNLIQSVSTARLKTQQETKKSVKVKTKKAIKIKKKVIITKKKIVKKKRA